MKRNTNLTAILFLVLSLFVSTARNFVTSNHLSDVCLFYITWCYTLIFMLLFGSIFGYKALKHKTYDVYAGVGLIISAVILIFENYVLV